MDNVTFQVLTAVLTITGGVISAFLWKRRGPASGIRALAWTLLPLAAFLTGTLRLVWEIGAEVATWAFRLVFSPIVWLGVVVGGVSVLLFVVSAFMRRRGVGTAARRTEEVEGGGAEKQALPPKQRQQPADDDLADIESILKKHGIS